MSDEPPPVADGRTAPARVATEIACRTYGPARYSDATPTKLLGRIAKTGYHIALRVDYAGGKWNGVKRGGFVAARRSKNAPGGARPRSATRCRMAEKTSPPRSRRAEAGGAP